MEHNNFKRHFEYFKVNLFVAYRKLIEYKINFWSDFFIQVFYLFFSFVFLYFWQYNFGYIIGWSFIDYMFFFTLADSLWCLAGIFFWQVNMFGDIISGDLNNFLRIPINRFIGYNFSKISSSGLIMFIMNIPILLFLSLNMHIVFYRLLYFIILSLLVVIFIVVLYFFLNSLEFYKKKLSFIFRQITFDVNHSLVNYPFQYFAKYNIKYFLLFSPALYYSSLLVPILRGYEIWNLELHLLILFSLIILFSLGTWFNWSYGLKRYEAYG